MVAYFDQRRLNAEKVDWIKRRFPNVACLTDTDKTINKYHDLTLGDLEFANRFGKLVVEYMSVVREFQALVKGRVKIDPWVTETDGNKYEHLFDTGWRAKDELVNWGLTDRWFPEMPMMEILSTGHCWVTVHAAKFNSQVHNQEEELEKMKALHDRLCALHSEIWNRRQIFSEFSGTVAYAKGAQAQREGKPPDECHKIVEDFWAAVRAGKETADKELYLIHKGIVSPSFTSGLIYRLEESLKHHPGD